MTLQCDFCKKSAIKLHRKFGTAFAYCEKHYKELMDKTKKCVKCKRILKVYDSNGVIDFHYAMGVCNDCYADENWREDE